MKEASCHDSKTAAYYNEVQKLKERFDGLELHHILRQDNLAADSLDKIALSWGPAPSGVFINDAHEPSVQAHCPHEQSMGAAGKVEPALLVEHHHDLEAASPPDLMAIDRVVVDTRTD